MHSRSNLEAAASGRAAKEAVGLKVAMTGREAAAEGMETARWGAVAVEYERMPTSQSPVAPPVAPRQMHGHRKEMATDEAVATGRGSEGRAAVAGVHYEAQRRPT